MQHRRRDEEKELLDTLRSPEAAATVGGISIFIKLMGMFTSYMAAQAKIHVETTHVHMQTPDNNTVSYSPHVHTGRHHYFAAQTPQCYATHLVQAGKSSPGDFKRLDNNAVYHVDNDPVAAARECLFERVDEIKSLSPTNKVELKKALQKVLDARKNEITPENQKQFADFMSHTTFIVRNGKPHECGMHRLMKGSGYASYNPPRTGFLGNDASVTLYSGHSYTERHLEQIAENLVSRLITALPRTSIAQMNTLTRRGMGSQQ